MEMKPDVNKQREVSLRGGGECLVITEEAATLHSPARAELGSAAFGLPLPAGSGLLCAASHGPFLFPARRPRGGVGWGVERVVQLLSHLERGPLGTAASAELN